jgi:DNA (cytosine-5)-methyltransferase 1
MGWNCCAVRKLAVLDLFSGIGGFSLGLGRTGGFSTVAFCEIDPFARRVLAKHWPDIPVYDDVRTTTAERLLADNIGSIDVVCGGFPCQDISVAGRGAGIRGERSGLWFEMSRIIAETRPKFVIAENVAALRSKGLDEVLGSLSEIGYDAEWHCIPASAVGAPHRRDRIWIIAYPAIYGRERIVREDCIVKALYDDALETLDAWNGSSSPFSNWSKLLAQPPTCRMADGVSSTVDIRPRLHAYGNAVVPQIPEIIGRALLRTLHTQELK